MYVLTKEEIKRADFYTINDIGIKEEVLMENAGQKMAEKIAEVLKNDLTKKISVFCGSGNNAGDGFVVARRLNNLGFFVEIFLATDKKKLKNAAALNFSVCQNLNIKIYEKEEDIEKILVRSNLIVDALFGISFRGELSSFFSKITKKINDSKKFVVSLDVPSGVYADFNIPDYNAVKANLTLTVSFFKQSCFLYPSKLNYGKIVLVDADVLFSFEQIDNLKRVWTKKDFEKTRPIKKEQTNKKKEGQVLIVGASNNMPGSIGLATKACVEAGAGLTFVATTNFVKNILANHVLEATYLKTEEEDGFLKDLEINRNFDVAACGIGLARKSFSKNVVKKVALLNSPVIFDADAFFFFDDEILNIIKNRKHPTILTPHSFEMAKICGCDETEVSNNRFLIAKQKAKELNSYIVLKGPFTLTTTPNLEQFVNCSGNSGLAKGGSGDVLLGIIAYFVAKEKDTKTAVLNAVYAHGRVCDLLLEKGETKNTITPTKIVKSLKVVL